MNKQIKQETYEPRTEHRRVEVPETPWSREKNNDTTIQEFIHGQQDLMSNWTTNKEANKKSCTK